MNADTKYVIVDMADRHVAALGSLFDCEEHARRHRNEIVTDRSDLRLARLTFVEDDAPTYRHTTDG